MSKKSVRVNQKALVQKVLARYPEEFTVFRELVQNADDAGAENVEIEFQTKEYAGNPSGEMATDGTQVDLSNVNVFKWVVRNDGAMFQQEDWDRITTIAEGNPDEQKIGTFGVGFFSVFSVTECPVVISGSHRKKMFYEGDQLMVESGHSEENKWTIIEMQVKDAQPPTTPKPFDLSRFLCTAVTFLAKVKKVTVVFNGKLLSEIAKFRGEAQEIELPMELKLNSGTGGMTVESVEIIPQKVRVTLTKLAYSAGSKHAQRIMGTAFEKEEAMDPATRSDFFQSKLDEPMQKAGPNAVIIFQDNIAVVDCTVYSAKIISSSTRFPGLEEETKKKPPSRFLYEAMHLTREQYHAVMQHSNRNGSIGSVFRGVQGLCSEEEEGHGSRLFIGQSTSQTSGIAVHLSSQFIPTVERGSIDLANGQVAKWNEELLYVGGLLMRLVYEHAMKDVGKRWTEAPSPIAASLKDSLREEALYTMKCFTFRQSTPDSKVGELLRDAFFNCSTSSALSILSNLGIRDSKEVRQAHADFQPFMKERPVLDSALQGGKSAMIAQLPKEYKVKPYTFRDVLEELRSRTFTEEEMIAYIGWWVKKFGKQTKQTSVTVARRSEMLSAAKFRSSSKTSPQDIELSTITKFVDTRPGYRFVENDDPLPPDTIPIPFTSSLDSNKVMVALGWKHLSIVEWIQHVVSSQVDPSQDIRQNDTFSEKVLATLWISWSSMKSTDRATIVIHMRSVKCVPTNQGHFKPQDAYLPEADLFNELPVIQLSQRYDNVLRDLGVNRHVKWCDLEQRVLSTGCSMMRLTSYLQTLRTSMDAQEFMHVKELPIFACETGTRHYIQQLYSPVPIHRDLGLPVLRWDDDPTIGPTIGYESLYELGLRQYPSLELIIENASSDDDRVRTLAYNFFIRHLDNHYKHYHPANFPISAFLPYKDVFTSSEWEIFGFHTVNRSVTSRDRARLKVKDRPTGAAIIQAMRENSSPSKHIARKWFELLAVKGILTADELVDLSEMKIVPPQYASVIPSPDETIPKDAVLPAVEPYMCFYSIPDHSKAHHMAIFTYVNYGQTANRFLKMCGAKLNPDISDIVEAMIADPQGYLDKTEAYLAKFGLTKAQAYRRYLDDLRQVAAGYQTLTKELRDRMRNAPIFISLRNKRRALDRSSGADSQEYALKHAHEVLIADDLESLQLFSEHIFVAPKEEVFEKFYRDHGSASLSGCVKHVIMNVVPSKRNSDAKDLQHHVWERLAIFLLDQESMRRSGFDVLKSMKEGGFTVKHCKSLEISKSLEFEHAIDLNGSEPKSEHALAGIEVIDGIRTLWVVQEKKKPDNSRNRWYDIAVALCRVTFKTHKTNDTLLLMTILDAKLDDLKSRGYDVDAIKQNVELAEPVRAPKESQPTPTEPTPDNQPRNTPDDPPATPLRLPFFGNIIDNLMGNAKEVKKQPFDHRRIEDTVSRALRSCQSDAGSQRQENQDKSKAGKKLRDVKYCDSHRTKLVRCSNNDKQGMPVFKAINSRDPPEALLETFSLLLVDLRELFGLAPNHLHIFWQPDDTELMGFNRNDAIYLNLAHYDEKHANLPPDDDNSRATTYAAWYFIIAHEIAHNLVVFHDEDHELLVSLIAQRALIGLRQLLLEKAPGAINMAPCSIDAIKQDVEPDEPVRVDRSQPKPNNPPKDIPILRDEDRLSHDLFELDASRSPQVNPRDGDEGKVVRRSGKMAKPTANDAQPSLIACAKDKEPVRVVPQRTSKWRRKSDKMKFKDYLILKEQKRKEKAASLCNKQPEDPAEPGASDNDDNGDAPYEACLSPDNFEVIRHDIHLLDAPAIS
ncbi:hypothetical protein BU15DRAFT_78434 [Melanogaster broomeanus]|nr:hypothetical protein BU15DRAFT_78434 [Melanogaster broomeanus]